MLPADRWVSLIHSLTPFSSSSIFLGSFKPTQWSHCIVLCVVLCEKQENFNCRRGVFPQWHQRGEPSWDCSHHTLPACLFIDYLLPLYFSLSHQWGSCVTWKLNGSLFPASEVIHIIFPYCNFLKNSMESALVNAKCFFFFSSWSMCEIEDWVFNALFQLYYNQSTLANSMVFLIRRHVTKSNMFQVHPLSSRLAFFPKKNSFKILYVKSERIIWGHPFIHQQHDICKTVISWKVAAVINSFSYEDSAPFS